ncbi:TOBE domain-containing protein [Aliagarivorans taiwanensis]|uniref:TOBE domain-containing protein n=1 Tax=Aliagarivorans taiwanensis TaxID=561966 RepID=UPI000418547D|nr:TOBE domain-containing protein [Aliagarivorans taiwanensis]
MKLSARNQLTGTIKSIQEGAINDEIAIELSDGVVVTSIITKGSANSLDLKVGGTATAVIKASDVMIAV